MIHHSLTMDNGLTFHTEAEALAHAEAKAVALKQTYPNIPLRTLQGFCCYVYVGYEPGSFVSAVLRNDLKGAFAHCDQDNFEALPDISIFCTWCLPGNLWGSDKAFYQHLRSMRSKWSNEKTTPVLPDLRVE